MINSNALAGSDVQTQTADGYAPLNHDDLWVLEQADQLSQAFLSNFVSSIFERREEVIENGQLNYDKFLKKLADVYLINARAAEVMSKHLASSRTTWGVEYFSKWQASFKRDFEDIQLIAGTNAISDVLTDAQMFLQGVNQQKSHVILLVQWAKEFAVGARARVSVTGHSLGGGLAQFTAVEFGLSGETFNAFGVAEMVGGARADRRKAVQAGTRTSVSTMTHESDLA